MNQHDDDPAECTTAPTMPEWIRSDAVRRTVLARDPVLADQLAAARELLAHCEINHACAYYPDGALMRCRVCQYPRGQHKAACWYAALRRRILGQPEKGEQEDR